jgi:hypothetical protein
MGTARLLIYRFDGQGQHGQQSELDLKGQLLIPRPGHIFPFHDQVYTVEEVDTEVGKEIPTYVIYLHKVH